MPLNFACIMALLYANWGGRGAAGKKKIAIQLKKNLSFFHSHFLLSSFFPSEIFLINTSLIFYNSLLIFLKTVSKNFFLLPMVFFS